METPQDQDNWELAEARRLLDEEDARQARIATLMEIERAERARAARREEQFEWERAGRPQGAARPLLVLDSSGTGMRHARAMPPFPRPHYPPGAQPTTSHQLFKSDRWVVSRDQNGRKRRSERKDGTRPAA